MVGFLILCAWCVHVGNVCLMSVDVRVMSVDACLMLVGGVWLICVLRCAIYVWFLEVDGRFLKSPSVIFLLKSLGSEFLI